MKKACELVTAANKVDSDDEAEGGTDSAAAVDDFVIDDDTLFEDLDDMTDVMSTIDDHCVE